MGRFWKQLIYGTGFLLITIFIIGMFYWKYFRPPETCFDEKLNQDEEQIDCGGLCISCEVKGRELATSSVEFLPSGDGQISFMTKVKNPSTNFDARFRYQFEIFGKFGEKLKSVEGASYVSPGEERFVVIPGVSLDSDDVESVSFDVIELNWVHVSETADYEMKFTEVSASTKDNSIKVTGKITNGGPVPFKEILVTSILYDTRGLVFNASTAEVSDVGAFQTVDFTIFFPEVEGMEEILDTDKIDIFWEAIS